jgi:hypothetical protein
MDVTEVLEPWYVTDQNLIDELKKEVKRGHILYRLPVKTVARRMDNDDVLFEVLNRDDFKFARVHLTWQHSHDPQYPLTETYSDWQQVYEQVIVPDHADWNA